MQFEALKDDPSTINIPQRIIIHSGVYIFYFKWL